MSENSKDVIGDSKIMKTNCFLCLMVMALTALVQGCGNRQKESLTDLVVVEQTDSVQGNHEGNSYCWASFKVDVPVNGPLQLVDSVLALVNREVYKMCEYCIEFDESPDEYVEYSEKEMFTRDGEGLLRHYMKKYKPLIADSLWNTFSLDLKMEAQTEHYVTYGMEFIHCGGSCGSEKYYYTFSKIDGHQVRDIITHQNLVMFFENHPEYKTVSEWEFSADNIFNNSQYGILKDNFTLTINGVLNHYLLNEIPYSDISSYLSPEARALVEPLSQR